MKPYPEYKDSGVEWIGEIPEEWKTSKIKYLAIDNNTLFTDGDWIESNNIVFDDTGIRYITTGNIGEGKFKEQGASHITNETFAKLDCTEIFCDDLLISRLNPPIGRCCIIPDLGKRIVTSVDNVVLRPGKNFYKKYLMYMMCNIRYFEYTALIARGATMQRISRGLLGDIPITIPNSISEQKQIAKYLDHKTAQIDSLIEKKKRLIELLREERTAVINQAVTKGLDPNVPMKDSGIEWLGEIPANWEFVRLKYLAQIKYGLGQPPRQIENGIPIIRATNVSKGKIIEKDLMFIDPTDVPYDRDPVLKTNDIIVVRSGAYTADSAIIPKKYDGAITGYDMVVRAIKVYPEYIAYSLLSNYVIDNQLTPLSLRAAQPHLNAEELGSANILAPPKIKEQISIVKYINKETTRIDTIISKSEKEIELLQEYRTALISEVVTGKIDVREERI